MWRFEANEFSRLVFEIAVEYVEDVAAMQAAHVRECSRGAIGNQRYDEREGNSQVGSEGGFVGAFALRVKEFALRLPPSHINATSEPPQSHLIAN